jgi:hypothetical protein
MIKNQNHVVLLGRQDILMKLVWPDNISKVIDTISLHRPLELLGATRQGTRGAGHMLGRGLPGQLLNSQVQ